MKSVAAIGAALAMAILAPAQDAASANRLLAEGRFAEARDAAARAVTQAVGGTPACQIAAMLLTQGLAESSLGEFSRATRTFGEGVALCEKDASAPPVLLVALLTGLGESRISADEFELAGRVLGRALTLAESSLPAGHARTATVLDALGLLQLRQGMTARAESSFRRALTILAGSLGPDHPDTASRSLTLASLLVREGRKSDAEPILDHARRVLETKRGPTHPDTLFAILTQAVIRIDADPAGAETMLRAAVDSWQTPEPHVTAGKLWNALAAAQYRRRRYGDAAASGRRSLEIMVSAVGREHRQTVIVMENLGQYLALAGRKRESASLRSEAEKIRRRRGWVERRTTVDIRTLLER